jgi:hypothetical protein
LRKLNNVKLSNRMGDQNLLRVDVRQAAGRNNNAESLSQYDEKHVVPTPLSEIRVGR